jgi:acetyl-CoA carboxylase biotin carboxylase subunit
MSNEARVQLKPIKKVLIANRGEIALRIIRACHDLGIKAVAVYSEADRHSLHVRQADEAYLIGPAPSKDSYLRIDRLLEVAAKSGADAVHPGYGFLAENAGFAQACLDAGLIYVGPPPSAIHSMGDKVQAKQLAQAAGVPLVPGIQEELSGADEAMRIAAQFGYPVLLKAAAGGGGKGMREVHSASEMEAAFGAATREAKASFANGAVYIEKLLQHVKHVEIQILADNYGNVIYLGERECSLQRRHQKMLEESPSMVVDADMRQRMGSVAVAAARRAGYVSAGTIEFLVTGDKQFYFIEMNTRLQVEHPVTELVTGFDIVTEQLKIAMGMPLSITQEQVQPHGWAIECRVTSEDPFNNFLPSIGKITKAITPNGPGVRLDSAVFDGYEVSLYYDPMIAKLITWGVDREQAIQRMHRALAEYKIVGVNTTIPFHQQLLSSQAFLSGDFYTDSLETDPSLKPDPAFHHDQAALAAIIAALVENERVRSGAARTNVNSSTPNVNSSNAVSEVSYWKEAGRREVLRRSL